jgi:hypothetical protein
MLKNFHMFRIWSFNYEVLTVFHVETSKNDLLLPVFGVTSLEGYALVLIVTAVLVAVLPLYCDDIAAFLRAFGVISLEFDALVLTSWLHVGVVVLGLNSLVVPAIVVTAGVALAIALEGTAARHCIVLDAGESLVSLLVVTPLSLEGTTARRCFVLDVLDAGDPLLLLLVVPPPSVAVVVLLVGTVRSSIPIVAAAIVHDAPATLLSLAAAMEVIVFLFEVLADVFAAAAPSQLLALRRQWTRRSRHLRRTASSKPSSDELDMK